MRRTGVRGQTTLLLVSVLCAVGVIVLMSSLDVFNKDYTYKSLDFDQVLLDEATSSSFAVMESALARRMWEPPPDNSCLRSETFSVSGSLPNGTTWKVDTTFNLTTKNFEMTATGSYRKLTSIFKKRVKVLDVSDYLLFSGNDSEVFLGRAYNEKTPTTMIARDRRIYTRGPLTFAAMLPRTNPRLNWSGTPSMWPGEYGTIIQGDRMQFGGGIYYTPYDIPLPNPDASSNIVSLLTPYAHSWGSPSTHYSSYGGGVTLFMKDYSTAATLQQQVINGSGPLTKSALADSVYPVALFGGNPPLDASKASDSGTYFNDVDRYSIFTYAYALANNFGIRINATCISDSTSFSSKKYCSHSEHFPKGFKKWRKDAGLEGYLYTSDAEVIPSPNLNWDNMEALEEDAQACGQVVSSPTSAYEDCPIWESNFLNQYASSGAGTSCPQVSSVDMEKVSFNNFDAAALEDTSKESRLLRRVIYLKVPTAISQSAAKGLMLNAVSSDTGRKNLSVWVVSEDLMYLRGYQNDTSSPLSSDPGRLREVVFNQDGTGANKQAISMVLVSPEQVHLLSPFYVPMTSSHLKDYWPVSGGKIRPINHIFTDATRQENDGFKYGFRKFTLNNISLISSSALNSSKSFYLQGLWSGPDSSASQMPANLCMVTLAGHPLTPDPGHPLADSAVVPASYQNAPLSPIPPSGSNYYAGSSSFPIRYYPGVFWTQINNGNINRQESDLMFQGIRIYADFDKTVPEGKRDLSQPKYTHLDGRWISNSPFDLSHKNFAYDYGVYYKAKAPWTPCILENVEFLSPDSPSSKYDSTGVTPSVNHGSYVFVHTAPSNDYRNIGSIVGVDQPVIETRSK